jgi:hypothetical protein
LASGGLECIDVRFASVADLPDAIERILAPLGRRVDEAEPLCDARLPDRIRASHGARRPIGSGVRVCMKQQSGTRTPRVLLSGEGATAPRSCRYGHCDARSHDEERTLVGASRVSGGCSPRQ